jgi:hypothetical protein
MDKVPKPYALRCEAEKSALEVNYASHTAFTHRHQKLTISTTQRLQIKPLASVLLVPFLLFFAGRVYAADPAAFACDDGACGNGKGSWIELVIAFLIVATGVVAGSARTRVLIALIFLPTIALMLMFGSFWIIAFIPMILVAAYLVDGVSRLLGIKDEEPASQGTSNPQTKPIPIGATPTVNSKPVLASAVSVVDDRQKDIENFGEDLCKATIEIASSIAYLKIFPKGWQRVDCGGSHTVVKETLGEDHLSGMIDVMAKVASQHVPPRPHITPESEVSEGDFVEDHDTLTPPSTRVDLVMRFGQDLVDFWERVAQIECSRILKEKAEYTAIHPEVRSNKNLRKDGGPKFFGMGDNL